MNNNITITKAAMNLSDMAFELSVDLQKLQCMADELANFFETDVQRDNATLAMKYHIMYDYLISAIEHCDLLSKAIE